MTDVRPDAHQRVTLQDVADRAGVSLTTASRVVNDGSRKVGKALAERQAALLADGEQRPQEVLPVSHPAGHPVQGDMNDLARHQPAFRVV